MNRRTRIKICGITTLADALYAAELGADALGFIFYPQSPRYIPPEQVRAFAEAIQAAGVQADYRQMTSDHGHDAFLAEQAELVRLLQ